jgi:cell wall-associated NlpC family hydrolase
VPADELDPAAELLERLLTDGVYRAHFRRDPVAACREQGLDDLAAELAGSGGSAMHTLELRESKSSLAGVMLAAAAEGVGVYALVHHVGPFLDGHAAKVVHRALTLPKLDAVRGKLAHAPVGSANAAVGSLPGGGGAGPGAEPAAQAAPMPVAQSAGASPEAAASPGAAAPASAGAPAPPGAAAPADAAASPGAPAPPGAAAPADATATPGAPAPADAAGAAPPAGHSAPWPSDDAGVARAGAPPVAADAAGHPVGAAAEQPAAAAADAAPASGGAGGDVQALLENPKLTLPPAARQALESGTVDPRLVAMLGKLLGDHQIGVSNHVAGGGLDISSVDGRPVNPANDAAREVAGELAALPAAIRPSQVGTPFNIGGGGFFTDADHQDHIHVAFDTPAPHPAAAAADAVAAPEAAAPKAEAALHAAEKQLGTPYLWGGAGPDRFDCSGLMQWAYKQVGVDLPRVAEDQAHVGVPVPRDQLRPGDLIPFADPSGYVHHIGMYVGDGKFIHAPHTGDVVKISSLDEPYYAQQYAGARRVVSGGVAAAVRAVASSAQAPPAGAAPAADQVAGAPARSDTAAFEAIAKQEASWHRQTAQFLQAVKERPDWATPRAAPGAPDTPAASGAPEPSGASSPVDLGDAPSDYPGDNAPREEIARWMAAAAKRAGLPPELPVMASLVESGMHNLSGGDRDSVGFFQMRVGIWNQGAYAGYPDHPQLQLKWFIDQALAVKHQRIAAGRAGELTDPQRYGEFIADIERPAEQFRGRYQLQLSEAQRLLGGGA